MAHMKRFFAFAVILAAIVIVGTVERSVMDDAAQVRSVDLCPKLSRGQWLYTAIEHCPDRAPCTHECWYGHGTAKFAL